MSPSPGPDHEIDPARLEEGLRRLRGLGYLQSPAEEYLARRVGLRRSDRQTAVAVGLWVGGALGVLGALLLAVSAVLSEPALLRRPEVLLALWLELTLVLVLAGALVTGPAAAVMLALRGRGGRSVRARLEVLVVLAPSLASSLYLADRLGRALARTFGEGGGLGWWVGAVLVAVGVGLVGSAVAWSVSSAVALGRMQSARAPSDPVLSAGQRLTPWLLVSSSAFLLLVLGPYRGLDDLPPLDDVVPMVSAPPRSLFLVTLDGVGDPREIGLGAGRPVGSADEIGEHPAAYWNEVATGFTAREHGVGGAAAAGLRGWEDGVGAMSDDPLLAILLRHLLPGVGLGETIAADRRDLRRPPVWEIAAVAGRRVRAINCWATYPAARREGLEVISDREFLRLYEGVAPDSFVAWPPSFAARSDAAWRERLRERRSSLDGYRSGERWLRDYAPGDTALTRIWDLATAADVYHLERATEELAPAVGPSLVVVHLTGADLLERALRDAPGPAATALRGYFHDFLAESIARMELPDPYTVVYLGRASGEGGEPPGAWVVGDPAAPEQTDEWAAWLLWTQGVLPARDLPTPPAIPAATLQGERPATFGRLHVHEEGAARSGADLERLRSLGYIGG